MSLDNPSVLAVSSWIRHCRIWPTARDYCAGIRVRLRNGDVRLDGQTCAV